MSRGEIQWKGTFEDGRQRQARANRTGDQWAFYEREKRFDPWRPLADPSLEDWLALLDGVERRVARRRFTEEDVRRIRTLIRHAFPAADP